METLGSRSVSLLSRQTHCVGNVEVVLGCIECVEEGELSLSAGIVQWSVPVLGGGGGGGGGGGEGGGEREERGGGGRRGRRGEGGGGGGGRKGEEGGGRGRRGEEGGGGGKKGERRIGKTDGEGGAGRGIMIPAGSNPIQLLYMYIHVHIHVHVYGRSNPISKHAIVVHVHNTGRSIVFNCVCLQRINYCNIHSPVG